MKIRFILGPARSVYLQPGSEILPPPSAMEESINSLPETWEEARALMKRIRNRMKEILASFNNDPGKMPREVRLVYAECENRLSEMKNHMRKLKDEGISPENSVSAEDKERLITEKVLQDIEQALFGIPFSKKNADKP